MARFQVIAHERPSGSCPFREHVEGVPATGRIAEVAKIQAAVQKLAESGSAALVQIGLAEKMNDVWQLRPGRHRVFYFLDAQRQLYVLLNGYLKRSRRTPSGELRRAESLMEEYLEHRGT